MPVRTAKAHAPRRTVGPDAIHPPDSRRTGGTYPLAGALNLGTRRISAPRVPDGRRRAGEELLDVPELDPPGIEPKQPVLRMSRRLEEVIERVPLGFGLVE